MPRSYRVAWPWFDKIGEWKHVSIPPMNTCRRSYQIKIEQVLGKGQTRRAEIDGDLHCGRGPDILGAKRSEGCESPCSINSQR